MWFVFADCPVLCLVAVRSTHCLLCRHFDLWLVCSFFWLVYLLLFFFSFVLCFEHVIFQYVSLQVNEILVLLCSYSCCVYVAILATLKYTGNQLRTVTT